jgi:N-acetylglucosaminyl-diphospho-decaprenol L-rhamnosyltransferase
VTPDPGVVVVTYNSASVLTDCLASVTALDVVVVDNASSDDSVAVARAHGARVVEHRVNRGFAAGVNSGLRAFDGRDVLLLNPDVAVEAGAVARLAQTLAAHPRAAIVAPMLLYADGSRQESARSFKTWTAVLARRTAWQRTGRGRAALDAHLGQPTSMTEPTPVDWVLGAAMLIRSNAVHDVGGMDEGFFLYEEDVDWCARMWRSGWEVLYEPRARMLHRYARASGSWWNLTSRPSRAHWHSLARLARKYPAPFFLGRPLRSPHP